MSTALQSDQRTPRHAEPPAASHADAPTAPRHQETAPALSMRDVTVRHRDGITPGGAPRFHTALDAASLALQPGSFTVLLGPSGSGKSTLLSTAAGLVVPDSGSVQVAGRELTVLGDDERSEVRRTLLGLVFQQPNLFASLSVMEQLLLPRTLGGERPGQQARDRARELLARVGLDGLEGRRPHQLSGGQRQRVAIARALMGSPRLLLVDEPTSALDRDAAHAVTRLFASITRDPTITEQRSTAGQESTTGASGIAEDGGVATLMVTHDQTLAAHADRVLTICDGRLREDTLTGTPHPQA